MYDKTITLFNYHAANGVWYAHVIDGVDLRGKLGKQLTTQGENNNGTVTCLIRSNRDKTIQTQDGALPYVGERAYQSAESPEDFVTFTSAKDFFYVGVYDNLAPEPDDYYESGYYDAMNRQLDGVYLIESVSFTELLPHFDIEGR